MPTVCSAGCGKTQGKCQSCQGGALRVLDEIDKTYGIPLERRAYLQLMVAGEIAKMRAEPIVYDPDYGTSTVDVQLP